VGSAQGQEPRLPEEIRNHSNALNRLTKS
jgi:hypothetical protein